MSDQNQCMYCTRSGTLRVSKEESDQLVSDVHICDNCWRLLQNPSTALPLIRGHLTMTLGKTMPESKFNELMDNFMDMVSKFKPQN
jgi:hypothetical protein